MSKAIDNLMKAMERGTGIRPKVGGFPYLAESLRLAAVTRNIWSLPACQSLFLTDEGPVVMHRVRPWSLVPRTCQHLIETPLSQRYEPIKPAKEHFKNFSKLVGVRELFAMTWIFEPVPSPTLAATAKNTSKHIQRSKSASANHGTIHFRLPTSVSPFHQFGGILPT